MMKIMATSDSALYGAFSDDYEETLVPHRFHAPGRDLLAMLQPRGAGRMLDLGTGTGVMLDLCVEAGGPFELTIGVDPSVEMLRVARSKGHAHLTVAKAPGLPYAEGAFDAVTANFVLSHLFFIEDALRDVLRVLKPGGQLAVSSWGQVQDRYRDAWLEVVGEFIDLEVINKVSAKAMPNESPFESLKTFKQLLVGFGLTVTAAHVETYEKTENATQFINIRSSMVPARIMARHLGETGWRRFQDRVLEKMSRDFDEPFVYSTPVNMITCRKI